METSQRQVRKVTVITAIYKRYDFIKRACESVLNQTYPNVEHIIVSDGPDPKLRKIYCNHLCCMYGGTTVKLFQLGRNWHTFHKYGWGAIPRLVATYLASGDYIAYLDDDNEFLPDHLEKMIDLLEREQTQFAYSMAQVFDTQGNRTDKTLGKFPVGAGRIDTNLIVHPVTSLRLANWVPDDIGSDWTFINSLLQAGAKYSFLPETTVNYYESGRE